MRISNVYHSALLISLGFILSCNQKQQTELITYSSETAISTVVDVTDPREEILWPKPQQILTLFECDKYPERAIRFALAVISNMKTNPRYSVFLPNAVETEKSNATDDAQLRKKLILKFYDSVAGTIQQFYNRYDTSKSLPYSECWVTIQNELTALSSNTATKKYLLIYSDLKELSFEVNAYKYTSKTNTELIQKELESLHPVPHNLVNIKVIIIYQPVSKEDDTRFTQMFFVYKQMLEAHGADVILNTTGVNLITPN